MVLELSPRSLRRPSFEQGLLAGTVLFAGYLLCRYDVCFQDSELLRGNMFDDGLRPRVQSYVASLITTETRLALWHVIPPHPSFTPVWILSLIVGPVLLFKFLLIELQRRDTAAAGTAVYLVSTGYLSGATMLFNAGKPLSNVAVIAALYLSARLRAAAPPSRELWTALLLVLGLAPFADEMAAFVFVIPVVWCPALFWPPSQSAEDVRACARRWFLLLGVAALDVFVILAVLPAIFSVAGRQLDVPGYLAGIAADGAGYARLDVHHAIWGAGNLLIPGLLPWSMAHVATPVAERPELPVAALLMLAALAVVVTMLLRSGQTHWIFFRKIAALMLIFIPFQTLAFVFHLENLSATGFYYGCMFSVLFAGLVAVVYAHVRDGRELAGVAAARLAVLWVVVISAANFLAINATYRAHNNSKTLGVLYNLPAYGHGANVAPLEDFRAQVERRRAQPSATFIDRNYLADSAVHGPRDPATTAFAMWSAWKHGDLQFLAGEPLSVHELWAATELTMEVEPRRWQTWLPWH